MPVRIDRASDDDLADLAALIGRTPSRLEPYSAEELRVAARRDPGAVYLVARAGGQIVGGALMYGGGEWTQPDRAFMITALVVAESHRGTGIGTALADALETHAFAAGARRVVTSIRADQEPGTTFALERGYREFHREYGATLDLGSVDGAKLTDPVAAVAAAGASLVTLRYALEVGRELVAQVQAAERALRAELPPAEIRFPDLAPERYEALVLRELDPDASALVVRDGAVLAMVHVVRRGDVAMIVTAGEVGAGRGRKLMRPLKTHAIRILRAAGVRELRSIMDRDNALTRQLNRSLAFEMLPPFIRYELRRPKGAPARSRA